MPAHPPSIASTASPPPNMCPSLPSAMAGAVEHHELQQDTFVVPPGHEPRSTLGAAAGVAACACAYNILLQGVESVAGWRVWKVWTRMHAHAARLPLPSGRFVHSMAAQVQSKFVSCPV
eukprot:366385-Chlamydomonas_euryale.AAC.3